MNNRRYLFAVVLIAVVAAGVWYTTRRVPFEPTSGRRAAGQSEYCDKNVKIGKIRIATFNIHRCKGRDGQRDVDRVAELLRGVDVAGLNEVHGGIFWDSTNQAEILGKKLHLAWLFTPTNRRLLNGDFGNGLLTKLPVRSWQSIPLPPNRCQSNRLALLVVLEYQDRPINLIIAHLAHRRDKKEVLDRRDLDADEQIQHDRARHVQLDTVISLFLSLAEPAILMGDFNTFPSDPLIQRLKNTPGVSDAVVEAGGTNPPNRVDWIFLRGLKCTEADMVKNDASDHPMVWADVEPIDVSAKQ